MVGDARMDALAERLHHILSILADGRRSLTMTEATQWKALALGRWQLRRALEDFVRFKHDQLLAPILASLDPAMAARAAAVITRNRALDATYRAFVDRWTLTSALSVDEHYQAEATRMSGRIEREVIADVQELESIVRAART